jgi:hypothetical protein
MAGSHQTMEQEQPRQCSYFEFLATQPPIFSDVERPLEADYWLRIMESKFEFLQCPEWQKARFAISQLHGPAGVWWATFKSTLPADHQVTWTEFKNAFRAHHLPAGIMRKKRNEFLDLKQGDKNVEEYLKAFNDLAQYAPDYVDTDARKKDRILRGLSLKL